MSSDTKHTISTSSTTGLVPCLSSTVGFLERGKRVCDLIVTHPLYPLIVRRLSPTITKEWFISVSIMSVNKLVVGSIYVGLPSASLINVLAIKDLNIDTKSSSTGKLADRLLSYSFTVPYDLPTHCLTGRIIELSALSDDQSMAVINVLKDLPWEREREFLATLPLPLLSCLKPFGVPTSFSPAIPAGLEPPKLERQIGYIKSINVSPVSSSNTSVIPITPVVVSPVAVQSDLDNIRSLKEQECQVRDAMRRGFQLLTKIGLAKAYFGEAGSSSLNDVD